MKIQTKIIGGRSELIQGDVIMGKYVESILERQGAAWIKYMEIVVSTLAGGGTVNSQGRRHKRENQSPTSKKGSYSPGFSEANPHISCVNVDSTVESMAKCLL